MASKWVGAVVGTFVVGDGTVVGPPVFQPDKPKITLKGKSFQTQVAAQLKQVNPGKAKMTLKRPQFSTLELIASSTVKPSPTALTKLTLKGKTGLRIVTPGRQVTGKPHITLKAKTFKVNRDQTMRPGKGKMTLRGGAITKAGKAGLVPTLPYSRNLIPTAVVMYGNLAPSPAEDRDLLVPTVEEFV